MEFYVYVWRDNANVPFYVGKGKGARARDASTRSEDFKEIYAKGGCSVEIVDWFIHESQAHSYECELIARYGKRDDGGTLVNKTDGGEGISGLVRSKETREKISAAKKGKKRGPLSDDQRAKLSAALRGRVFSTEHRAKIGAANSLRVHSAESVAKRSAARTGTRAGQETRAKMSLAHRMRPGRSGYKGVDFKKASELWRARINIGGEIKNLGSFCSSIDAAMAYDSAAYAAWGRDCYLNFPDKIGDVIAA